MRTSVIIIAFILIGLFLPYTLKDSLPPPKTATTSKSSFSNSESSAPINTASLTIDRTQSDKGVTYELIIMNTASFVDGVGYLHIEGEIQNNGDRKTRYVEVTAIFFDSDKNMVSFETTNTQEEVIFPGLTSSFEFIVEDESIISQIRSVDFQAKGRNR